MTTISAQPPLPKTTLRTPPTIGGFPLGVLPEFRRDPLGLYLRALHAYGDVVRLRFGPRYSYTVFHPEYVKHILVDNNKNYIRNPYSNNLLKEILGLTLLTADGDDWLQRRRLLQPAFHRQRIAGFGGLITDSAGEMLARWAQHPADETIDLAQEMMRVTLQVVGQALFSTDLLQESGGLAHSIELGSSYFIYRLSRLFAPPLWLPTKGNREYLAARKAVLHVVPAMIAARRRLLAQQGTAEATGRPADMIDLLLDTRDEDSGVSLSDEDLAQEIRMFIAAGHETTSNTLTWTLYLLSQHPGVEAKLQAEVDHVLAGRTPGMADLPRLVYTKMVIEEAMRLYPAAWVLSRQSIAEDQLGDYRLPAKQGLAVPIYAVHRHPEFWQEPEEFDPARFSPEQSAAQARFAFMSFGGGPRQCIGAGFALAEAQLILAMIAQRFAPRLQPGYQVIPEPLVTLRVKGGLPMKLVRRSLY